MGFSESDYNSKGSKLKARLCMRGDREENIDTIRSDFPTVHKDSLKLALAIAANENFDLVSGDIKSAFYSRNDVTKKSLCWSTGRLPSVLFGTEKEVEELGMRPVSEDSALFTNGQLIGIVSVHVDYLLKIYISRMTN